MKHANPVINKLLDSLSFNKSKIEEAKSGYEIYHDTYSAAVQHGWEQAEKRGYVVDEDDWFHNVASGPKKPQNGKTNSVSIALKDKNDKPVKKRLRMQVYNTGNKYELNMYIESVNEDVKLIETMNKIAEDLDIKDGLSAWIKHFQKSDLPHLKGKSDKKKAEMASAAFYYASKAKKTESKAESKKELDEGYTRQQQRVLDMMASPQVFDYPINDSYTMGINGIEPSSKPGISSEVLRIMKEVRNSLLGRA